MLLLCAWCCFEPSLSKNFSPLYRETRPNSVNDIGGLLPLFSREVARLNGKQPSEPASTTLVQTRLTHWRNRIFCLEGFLQFSFSSTRRGFPGKHLISSFSDPPSRRRLSLINSDLLMATNRSEIIKQISFPPPSAPYPPVNRTVPYLRFAP